MFEGGNRPLNRRGVIVSEGLSMIALLVDGYNLVSPIAAPSRNSDPNWLHRERMLLLERLAEHLPGAVLPAVCVVFDASNPPPDRPSQFVFRQMQVLFAVDHPEADDLIEELIAAHSSPKQLAVVSSDHRVQSAAKRRGAAFFDSERWVDRLLENRAPLSKSFRVPPDDLAAGDDPASGAQKSPPEDVDVEMWMKEFGFDD